MQSSQREQYTVTQLNQKAKSLLETQLNQIWVTGEVSNLSRPGSGHWYFTLKDDNAQIRCAMFRNRNALVKTVPKAGDQIIVRARVSLYEPRGDYQLIAEHMEAAGLGLLQKQFEALKARLHSEGLFNIEHKSALPRNAQKIAVITSPTGAALHDILNVLKRRSPSTEVIIIPSSVQGDAAPRELLHAIHKAVNIKDLDAIIIGRGGGSLEDLWAFNDEALARAIYACKTPIISAVGHEVDFSISDFVADVRAPTPSAAAELISCDLNEQHQNLKRLSRRLYPALARHQQRLEQALKFNTKRLKHPGEKINQWQQRTDICEQRLRQKMQALITSHKQDLHNVDQRLTRQSPHAKLPTQKIYVERLEKRLANSVNALLRNKQTNLAGTVSSLEIVSPLATLKRGYTIIKDNKQHIVKSASDCLPNTTVDIHFHNGHVKAKVLSPLTTKE